jgi:(E)-4-hydroxy-3-methylbut-2-enyl-diphosphate synthase
MIPKNFFNLQRFPSHEVIIGNRPMGGKQPIRLQSMTNTDTLDVNATVAQTIRIIEAGADYARISAPNIAAAEALKNISEGVRKAGFTQPLIADIHFNADVALIAARYVEKVRINPGNYTGGNNPRKVEYTDSETEQEIEKIHNRLKPLVNTCRENGTAIRIGTNLGSLSPRIIAQYGNTPDGMVNATYEFLEIFRELNFLNLVISLKASKPMIMIDAYEKMVKKMLENQMSFPLHIGITEAGEGENGRIKSALGICSLLNKGIGDTLRVSLTEDPELEIPFAKKLSSLYQIPFTQSENPETFKIRMSEFYRDDIPIAGQNHKAIVILGKSDEKEKSQATNAPLIEPDLIYTTAVTDAIHQPSRYFLLNYNDWKTLKPSNSIPLVNKAQAKLTSENEDFYLKVNCRSESPAESLEKISGMRGIVANFNGCGEIDTGTLVQFSQEYRIPIFFHKKFNTADKDELISHFAIFAGNYLLEKKIQGIWIDSDISNKEILDISFGFLQSSGLRITRTEFISCPTCARTSFDLQKVLKEVQQKTSNIPGLKIAVMGCIVNGPGEMADADFGFVGTGNGKLHLYKGKVPVRKNIEPSEATAALLDILKENEIDTGF